MAKYAIDACALINAAQNYNLQKKTFEKIWLKLDALIESHNLVSTVEVLDELKDDDLVNWVKQRSNMFLPLSEDVQLKAKEILKKFPTLIKMKSVGNSNADPFLIATAMCENAVIITDEKRGDTNTADFHIPNVCSEYGIECISFHDFLNQLLE